MARVTNRARTSRAIEEVSITGFSELDEQLRNNLPKGTSRGVLQRAGRKAMQPMLERAQELAPVRTGATRKSIRMIVKFLRASARLGAVVRIQIGAGDKETFWPKFQERGTVKMPPHPFMRPAFDAEALETIARLRAALATEIGKAIARRAKRLGR